MPVVACVNQKGGVGKTSTVLGLAGAASAADLHTLVIDLDPQANASQSLGLHTAGEVGEHLTVRDVLLDGRAGAASGAVAAAGPQWPGVDVLPCDRTLALVEHEGVDPLRLRTVLEGVATAYDIVLVDCPPSLGLLTVMGLAAADVALIVTTPSAYAVAGVIEVAQTVRVVHEEHNPGLSIAGIVVNLVRATREAQTRLVELREAVPAADVLEPVIPQRALIEEAAGAGAPLIAYGAEAATLTAAYATHLTRLIARPRRRVS